MRLQSYFQFEGKQTGPTMRARRDWIITDAATGAHFGCATSSWALLNFKTRRLGKMPPDVLADYRQHMPYEELHCIPAEETKAKLPAASEGLQCTQHTPSAVHTDMNDHVNNTAYLTWILDSIPDAVQETHVIAQYEIDYKAEARKGASVYASAADHLVAMRTLLAVADGTRNCTRKLMSTLPFHMELSSELLAGQ